MTLNFGKYEPNKLLNVFVVTYFLLFIFLFRDARLCPDSYYYWLWSQHLQLSYYDGPPLIAYLLRLYTTVFGEQELSLFLFSFSATAITTRLVWKCAVLLFDQATARYAVLLWLLTPGILHFFMLQVTYNVPMILFWGLSFYCFLQLLITKKTRYYYLGGLAVGCLLLAKYTGILLIISLFLGCLYYKDYRFILKSMHLYVGLGLALLLFFPVLIWNFQHDWMSFKFQLNHGFHSDANHPLVQVTSYLLHNFIEYNISLVALIVLIWQQRKTVFQPQQGMLFFPTFFVLFFFLATSFFAPTDINWSAPAFFTGLILLAHYLSALQRKIILYILFGMLSGLSFTLVVGDSQPKFTINKLGGWGMSYAMQKILPMIPEENYQNKMIVTETYQLSGLVAYFLKLQPDSVINMQQKYGRITKLKNDFSYLSYTPLMNKKGLLKHCKLENHYQSIQQHALYPAITWHLYLYQCKGMG